MAYTNIGELFEQLPTFKAKPDYLTVWGPSMALSQRDADSIVDSALDKQYQVPFSDYSIDPGPNLCPRIVTTIASLLTRSIFLSGEYLTNAANSQPRAAIALWDRAWMLLNKIINGDMQVTGSDVSPILSTNAGIWARKRKYTSPLKDFDLESPLYPRLHDQMRDGSRGLKMVADDGTVTYYLGVYGEN